MKKIVFYILMFIIPFTLFFVALEFTLGKYYFTNDGEFEESIFDPILGWRLKPGTYWIKPAHVFKKHKIHINSMGLHDDEISFNNGQGNVRIIVLGDSFTFGRSIPNEYLFPTMLENAMKGKLSGNNQIINAGVSGYGNAQELLLMKELADKNVTADMYLLMFFTNDILDNLSLDYGTLNENFVHPLYALDSNGGLMMKRPAEKFIDEESETFISPKKSRIKSRIFNVLKNRAAIYLQTKPAMVELFNKLGFDVKFRRMPGLLNGWYNDTILAQGVPLTRALLREIQHEANTRNSKLLIAFIPSPIQVYFETYSNVLKRDFPGSLEVEDYLNDPGKPQKIIGEISSELGIPYLDLLPVFANNSDLTLYIPRDGHFTKIGHRIVTEELTKFIDTHESFETEVIQ